MTTSAKAKRSRPAIKQESKAYFVALGNYISLLRNSRGMTQAELARSIGVSQQAVFAYELGERRVSVLILKKIGQLFLVSMDALAGMATPRPAPKNRRLSPRAMRHAERLMNLTKTAQRFVIRIIDTLEEGGHAQRSTGERKGIPSRKPVATT